MSGQRNSNLDGATYLLTLVASLLLPTVTFAAPEFLAFESGPVRPLDNQLNGDAANGRNFYMNTPVDATLTCEFCHSLDSSQGFFGTGKFSSFEGSTQIFKIPHLRNAYTKVGMFGLLVAFGTGPDNTGDQVRGFGFAHDGSVDTLFRFVSVGAFNFPNETTRRESEAFMLQFDNDIAPIVGQQITLDATNGALVGPRIDLMIARAGTPFTSLLLDGVTTECEVIVKGMISGSPKGWRDSPMACSRQTTTRRRRLCYLTEPCERCRRQRAR